MLPPYIIPAVLKLKPVAARPWLKLPVELGKDRSSGALARRTLRNAWCSCGGVAWQP